MYLWFATGYCNKFMDNFRRRLDLILQGRKIYPWAASLGVSKGVAESMSKGVIPGSEILNAIMCKENVNISWLLSGEGPIYRVFHYATDMSFAMTIDAYEVAQEGWNISLCIYESLLAVVLSRTEQYTYKDKKIDYQAHKLITGPCGNMTIDVLKELYENTLFNNHGRYRIYRLNSGDFYFLVEGVTSPAVYTYNAIITDAVQMNNEDFAYQEPQPHFEKLIKDIGLVQKEKTFELSIELMRASINLVDETAQEEGVTLSTDDKAKIYTAIYRHAERKNINAKDLDSTNVLSLLEVMK